MIAVLYSLSETTLSLSQMISERGAINFVLWPQKQLSACQALRNFPEVLLPLLMTWVGLKFTLRDRNTLRQFRPDAIMSNHQ